MFCGPLANAHLDKEGEKERSKGGGRERDRRKGRGNPLLKCCIFFYSSDVNQCVRSTLAHPSPGRIIVIIIVIKYD